MINLEHLQEITGNNNDLINSLLQQFLDITDIDFSKLKEAIKNNNLNEIISLSHRIKGAAGAVGAIEVEQLAAQLEASSRSGSGLYSEIYNHLSDAFVALKSDLDRS